MFELSPKILVDSLHGVTDYCCRLVETCSGGLPVPRGPLVRHHRNVIEATVIKYLRPCTRKGYHRNAHRSFGYHATSSASEGAIFTIDI